MPIKWLRKTGCQHTLLSISKLLFHISNDYFNNAAFVSHKEKFARKVLNCIIQFWSNTANSLARSFRFSTFSGLLFCIIAAVLLYTSQKYHCHHYHYHHNHHYYIRLCSDEGIHITHMLHETK